MKTKLTEEVVAKIPLVYQRLASNEILSRCTSGKSQNANESLHSVIWSHCLKESFQSKKRLEISVVAAVSEFNFGFLFTLKHVHQNASLPSMQISGEPTHQIQQQSTKLSQEEGEVFVGEATEDFLESSKEYLVYPQYLTSGRSSAMREKGGNRLVPGPDYMVDALKFSNQVPRGSGESLQKCVAWRCPDGTIV
ncbi:uncharacterized protein TNCV_1992491 [Trichonephila clavipes]|nr:uncharacterized protein TNCV_1992491 [Trichonephila clavipes]